MKNAAIVALAVVVAFAAGLYAGASRVLDAGARRPSPSEHVIPWGDTMFVTTPPDAKGIVVWTLKDGVAVRARSFWVHTGIGKDGNEENTIKEDGYVRPSD